MLTSLVKQVADLQKIISYSPAREGQEEITARLRQNSRVTGHSLYLLWLIAASLLVVVVGSTLLMGTQACQATGEMDSAPYFACASISRIADWGTTVLAGIVGGIIAYLFNRNGH